MGITGFNLARRLAEQEAAAKAASPSFATDAPPTATTAPECAVKPKRRRKPNVES